MNPFRLSGAKDALNEMGIHGLTVAEVKGFGRQQGQVALCRGAEYAVASVRKDKIEIAAGDGVVEKVDRKITGVGTTGRWEDIYF